MRNETWMRRYPGSFGAQLSARSRCFICGEPGYVVPAPPEPITLAEALTDRLVLRTGDTCPGHEYAVRRALYEMPQFSHLSWRS